MYTLWTGGIPSTNWDSTASALPETPFCYCLLNTTDQLKIHTTITKGLSKKFVFANSTYSLLAFKLGVWKHLCNMGMDLVFYFLDGNTGTMENIVNWHSIFLLANIRKIVCDKKVIGSPYKYNMYNLHNLTCSQTFLLLSLTDNLLHAIEQKITNKTSGPEIWMYIVDKTQSDSAQCHQQIWDLICGLHLTDFPGENVRLFNQKCLSMFCELDNANAMDDNLLLHLLEAYTKSATETFRVTFITQHCNLKTYLHAVKGKSIAVCLYHHRHQDLHIHFHHGGWIEFVQCIVQKR